MCDVLLPPGVNQMCDVLLPPGVNQMCDVLLPPGVNQMCDVLLPPGVNQTAVIYIIFSQTHISSLPFLLLLVVMSLQCPLTRITQVSEKLPNVRGAAVFSVAS
jgi:hypothetical protein